MSYRPHKGGQFVAECFPIQDWREPRDPAVQEALRIIANTEHAGDAEDLALKLIEQMERRAPLHPDLIALRRRITKKD
jgi:hypothetical protein